MVKLVLARLLPGALAGTLLWSALSPLRPALEGFARAANALAGEQNAGGVDFPRDLPGPGPSAPSAERARALREIASAVEKQANVPEAEALGWEAGDRAARPLGPKGKR
ncbi:MAG: hypothetical protein RL653_3550 [Pseudomonadota bacterium]|jgi:hypothetical protein